MFFSGMNNSLAMVDRAEIEQLDPFMNLGIHTNTLY